MSNHIVIFKNQLKEELNSNSELVSFISSNIVLYKSRYTILFENNVFKELEKRFNIDNNEISDFFSNRTSALNSVLCSSLYDGINNNFSKEEISLHFIKNLISEMDVLIDKHIQLKTFFKSIH